MVLVNAIGCTRHQLNMAIPKRRVFGATRMYVEGSSYGSIGRVLKVNPQSVANWIAQYTANCPNIFFHCIQHLVDFIYLYVRDSRSLYGVTQKAGLL